MAWLFYVSANASRYWFMQGTYIECRQYMSTLFRWSSVRNDAIFAQTSIWQIKDHLASLQCFYGFSQLSIMHAQLFFVACQHGAKHSAMENENVEPEPEKEVLELKEQKLLLFVWQMLRKVKKVCTWLHWNEYWMGSLYLSYLVTTEEWMHACLMICVVT